MRIRMKEVFAAPSAEFVVSNNDYSVAPQKNQPGGQKAQNRSGKTPFLRCGLKE